MIRSITIYGSILFGTLIFTCVLACGTDDTGSTSQDRKPAQTEDASAVNDKQANSPGGVEWIRKRYARVKEMEANNLLRCDTLSYDCPSDPVNGVFTYCYAGEELVRATHVRTIADHNYSGEEYYFDGDELYFTYLWEGSWHFAQPPDSVTDDSISYTRDDVREERRYFENSNPIERLFKTYDLLSWENRGPDDFPNQKVGEPVQDVLGSEAVLAQQASRDYSCPE